MSFLDYTGKYVHENGNYIFQMEEMKTKQKYEIKNSSYVAMADPSIDNTFKHVFSKNKNITIALLNALLFPSSNAIKNLEYLPNEFPGFGSFGSGSIKMDILCKCILKEDYEMDVEENHYKKNENIDPHLDDGSLIINIEMQIGKGTKNDRRFIKYLRVLDKNFFYRKVMVLALVYDPSSLNPTKNQSSQISLAKELFSKKYKVVENFEDCVFYQIDLNFCYKTVSNNEKISILEDNYLNEKGYEWIKFLTLSSWCNRIDITYFIFPPLDNIIFKDCELKNALNCLLSLGIAYEFNYIDHQFLMAEIKEIDKTNEEKIKLTEEVKEKDKKIEEITKERDEFKLLLSICEQKLKQKNNEEQNENNGKGYQRKKYNYKNNESRSKSNSKNNKSKSRNKNKK